mmetsp:Transcript_4899/g.5924  ORF Transcript_4899/g.5924 Transcript_4899/m.5924 type:complete len:489 (-) Transcript_4899:395-1861(-)
MEPEQRMPTPPYKLTQFEMIDAEQLANIMLDSPAAQPEEESDPREFSGVSGTSNPLFSTFMFDQQLASANNNRMNYQQARNMSNQVNQAPPPPAAPPPGRRDETQWQASRMSNLAPNILPQNGMKMVSKQKRPSYMNTCEIASKKPTNASTRSEPAHYKQNVHPQGCFSNILSSSTSGSNMAASTMESDSPLGSSDFARPSSNFGSSGSMSLMGVSTASSSATITKSVDVEPSTPLDDKSKQVLVDRRRQERNKREQRRSSQISKQIEELKQILAHSGYMQVGKQLNKFGVLQISADCIRDLQEQNRQLKKEQDQRIPLTVSQQHFKQEHGQIDALKLAENKDAVSESTYKHVFRKAALAMAIANTDGLMVECNTSFCNASGISLDEISQISMFALIRPEFLQKTYTWMSLVLNDNFSPNEDTPRFLTSPCVVKNASGQQMKLIISSVRNERKQPILFHLALTASEVVASMPCSAFDSMAQTAARSIG